MFGERAKQARSAAVTDLLKDLGVESPDKLKDALKRLSTIEEQGKTEAQKLTDQVAALQKQIETEKATAAEQVKAATLRLMQAEVVAEAAKQGVRADAVSDVWLFVDRDKITEKEGKFEGVKEAVEAVVKAKAYLLDQKKQGNGQGTPDRSKQGGGQTQQNQGGDQTRPEHGLSLCKANLLGEKANGRYYFNCCEGSACLPVGGKDFPADRGRRLDRRAGGLPGYSHGQGQEGRC